jgi:tetratricopeptide (TPR) repeat protein
MVQDQRARFQQLITQLSGRVKKQPQSAIDEIEKLLIKVGQEPNLLHLAGLAHCNLGQHAQGIDYLLRSLQSHAEQPEVHNNLGNNFKVLGELDKAEQHYRAAIELNQQFVEAWKNLGLLLLSQQRYEEARQCLKAGLALRPEDCSLLTSMGNVHRLEEDFERAMALYENALALNPNYVTALNNLGLCYKLTEKPARAADYFDRAGKLAPNIAEIAFNHGNAVFEMGDYPRAEALYLSAIGKNPAYILAHETLSELYWQLGQDFRIRESYDSVLAQHPDSPQLRYSLIQVLRNCGLYGKAREEVEAAVRFGSSARLLHLSGQLHASQEDYVQAQACFEQALEEGFDLVIAQDLTRLHIIEGEYDKALEILKQAQLAKPDDQLNWALVGQCWRLQGDPRYQWLIDYDRDVRVFTLATPEGYASLDEFLSELCAVLLKMHTTKLAPSRQTLVNGTQTPGRLLHKPHPVIAKYKWALEQAVTKYIEAMPDDDKHPLFSRKSKTFEFSGSWSVKLTEGGFHVNHVHPAGWISSACYIHLPQSMGSAEDNEGCIKFGESPMHLGEREGVEKIVRPLAGQLALFPSYLWHGTYDVHCAEGDFRLTAPFDVVPIAG